MKREQASITKTRPFAPDRLRYLSEKKVERVSGTLLLSDISGFTSISEALGEKGKEGTEELSHLLNNYFRGMLDIIQRHGGEVVKFCGDSLMTAFYEEPSGNVARACAREMMKETGKSGSMKTCAGDFDLSMKVVGQSGEWNETILGDNRRREHFLCGKVVRDLMAMEDRAESGDILVGEGEEQCAISNGQQTTNKQKADQDIRPARPPDWSGGLAGELRTMNSKEEKATAEERLKSLLPQGVAALIHKGSPGEHRAVSTVFLNFYGYDEENPQIDLIREFFNEVISITESYGGVIHDIDSCSRGSNVMILFGAPTSHENDAERAVMTSMELSKLSVEPLKVRVGICTGFVYAGIIGSDWRKEYAVIGDAVNTAERLMETAKGEEAIVSGSTCSLTLDEIQYKKLRSIKARGKEQLLKRFAPLGIKEEKHFRFGFVGREEEIKGIVKAVGEGGKAIILKGGAGVGKSRLLHEIRKRIEPTHKVLFGHTDQLKGSLHFFTSMIAREADIQTDEDENVRKDKLEKHIREIEIGKGRKLLAPPTAGKAEKGMKGRRGDPPNNRGAGARIEIESGELYKRLPFLGTMLFGIRYPDSLYDSVGESLRFENLCDAIRYYIEYHAYAKSESREAKNESTERDESRETKGESAEKDEKREMPAPLTAGKDETGLPAVGGNERLTEVVVILDDFQWLRKDAVRVVEYITRTLLTLSTERDRITFVFSGRPEPDALDKLPLSKEIDTVEFDLFPLPEESTAVLSSKILKNKPLPGDVAEIVFKRTQGNPFYLEQFLLDLMEKGLIREAEDKWVKTIMFKEEDVPENVFSTVISRVDRLEEEAKKALRIGSVVGMEFHEKIVGDILKEPNISHYLAQTEKESLTYKKAVGEMEHIFRHAMIKDVIYDSILRKQRREFHKLVGQGIEKLHEKEIERFYEVLAHHFGEAKEWEKALDYNLRAAKQTAKNYHNEAAIQYFLKTAEIGEEQSVGADLRACLYEAYKGLGDIHSSISSYLLSRGYYQNAIAAAGTFDKEKLVDALNGVADTYYRQGDYEQALKTGEEACVISREVKYKKGIAASLNSVGRVHYNQGRYDEALKCHAESLKIRKGIGDKRGIATSLNNISGVHYGQRRYEEALKFLDESLEIKREIGDKYGIAAGLNNIGLVHSNQGRYDEALRYQAESLEIVREIGDKYGLAGSLGNIGVVHSHQGRHDEALRYYAESLEIKREIGDKYGTAGSLRNMGIAQTNRGRYEKALKCYAESLGIFREIGDKYGIASDLNNIGVVYRNQGRYDEALEYYAESLEIERDIGDEYSIASGLGNIGLVHSDQGRYEEALKYYAECVEIFGRIGDKKGTASGLADIGSTYLSLGSFGDGIEKGQEALAVFEEIGDKAQMLIPLTLLITGYTELSKEHRLVRDSERGPRIPIGEACATKAKEAIRKAKRIEKQTRSSERIVPFRLAVSRFYESSRKLQLAHQYAEEGLEKAKELKQPRNQAEAYLRLCELWSGTINRQEARARSKPLLRPDESTCLPARQAGSHLPENGTRRKSDSNVQACATEALTIAKKTKSLSLLWKSHYWLYKATGDKKHLKKAKERLKEQYEHVPRKYLKGFKEYVRRYTGADL